MMIINARSNVFAKNLKNELFRNTVEYENLNYMIL